jgi:hypothetical protein
VDFQGIAAVIVALTGLVAAIAHIVRGPKLARSQGEVTGNVQGLLAKSKSLPPNPPNPGGSVALGTNPRIICDGKSTPDIP